MKRFCQHKLSQFNGKAILKVRKKPIIIEAIEINEPFEVETMEGVMKGKAGDFLMKGIDGELYVCDRDIFFRTYDIVED